MFVREVPESEVLRNARDGPGSGGFKWKDSAIILTVTYRENQALCKYVLQGQCGPLKHVQCRGAYLKEPKRPGFKSQLCRIPTL